jgi:hypothetical protein
MKSMFSGWLLCLPIWFQLRFHRKDTANELEYEFKFKKIKRFLLSKKYF